MGTSRKSSGTTSVAGSTWTTGSAARCTDERDQDRRALSVGERETTDERGSEIQVRGWEETVSLVQTRVAQRWCVIPASVSMTHDSSSTSSYEQRIVGSQKLTQGKYAKSQLVFGSGILPILCSEWFSSGTLMRGGEKMMITCESEGPSLVGSFFFLERPVLDWRVERSHPPTGGLHHG